jgi:hypothetical protein
MTRWFSKLFTKNVQSTKKTVGTQTVATKVSNEVKEGDRKVNVAQWVETQKASGIPLFDLWRQLMEKSGQTNELGLMEAYMNAANQIEEAIVSRNLKGKEYERYGEDNEAIILYEANIKDRFDGSHPYERLRVIYTKKRRYKDVIRVCEAYIHNGQHDPQLKTKYQQIIYELREKIDEK